jgi:hypothetical protein
MTAALFPILGGITYVVVAARILRSRKPTAGQSESAGGAMPSTDSWVAPS